MKLLSLIIGKMFKKSTNPLSTYYLFNLNVLEISFSTNTTCYFDVDSLISESKFLKKKNKNKENGTRFTLRTFEPSFHRKYLEILKKKKKKKKEGKQFDGYIVGKFTPERDDPKIYISVLR